MIKSGEIMFQEEYASPRLPPKISVDDNWMEEMGSEDKWMEEMGSEVVGSSEDSPQTQTQPKTTSGST